MRQKMEYMFASFDQHLERGLDPTRALAMAASDYATVYHPEEGDDRPIQTPRPRPIILCEWDEETRLIGFLCPSQDLARQLTAGMGTLVEIREGSHLFELRASPLFEFEEVLLYLRRLAGRGGVFRDW